MKRTMVAVGMMAACSVAQADRIYRCTDADGRPVFSQTHCGPDRQIARVDVRRPSDEQVDEAWRIADQSIAYIQGADANRRNLRSMLRADQERAQREYEAMIHRPDIVTAAGVEARPSSLDQPDYGQQRRHGPRPPRSAPPRPPR